MVQQALSSARVVDPVLTGIARGFKQPPGMQYISEILFPRVPVQSRAGVILSFGKEDFMVYSTARAPGAKTGRVQFGYASETFSLIDHSLEGLVPVELQQESMNGAAGINQATRAIRGVQRIMELSREVEGAALARTAATYGAQTVTLSGLDQWNSGNVAGDPFADVYVAREAIRAAIGMYPNTMVLGPSVMAALKLNATVLSRTTPTGRDLPSLELLSALFEIDRVVVGQAIQATDAGVTSDVWGKDVILAYTTPAGAEDYGSPNYGYTYQLDGYPYVEEPYIDRNHKSTLFPYTDARRPYLVGATAGYLIKNAVS